MCNKFIGITCTNTDQDSEVYGGDEIILYVRTYPEEKMKVGL